MNFHALYRSICDLVRDFLKDEAFSQQERTVRKYLKPDLVIIAKWGPQKSPQLSLDGNPAQSPKLSVWRGK